MSTARRTPGGEEIPGGDAGAIQDRSVTSGGFHEPAGRIAAFLLPRTRLLLTLLVALLVLLAWADRFIQDDAFISFRYADNLVRGIGLVWNPGEHTEGYTNFLWTMLMAGAIALGIDPVTASQAFGLVCFAASLLLAYRLASLLLRSRLFALLAVALIGTNYTFRCYATGGLETQLQAMLFLAGSLVCVGGMRSGRWSAGRLAGLSLILAASLLTRLDSALFCAVILAVTAAELAGFHPGKGGMRAAAAGAFRRASLGTRLVFLLAPLAVITGAWFFWKQSYYGDILPNTFYIKASSITSLERGFNFLFLFATSYFLAPFFVAGIFAGNLLLRDAHRPMLVPAAVASVWILYVLKVGGDFMEFRMLSPVIPEIMLVIVWLIVTLLRLPWVRVAAALLIVAGTIHHERTFVYSREDGIEPIGALHGHVLDRDKNWAGIGRVLGEAFRNDPDVIVATTAAGAIPYYSRLTAVDMLGINDPWVARHGVLIGTTPGHQRLAPLSYLIERRVNLVVSHPLVHPLGARATGMPLLPSGDSGLSNATIIDIPIDDRYMFSALYLTPHPAVDRAIAERGWKVRAVRTK